MPRHKPVRTSPKLLDGREVAGYLQERHARTVRSLAVTPKLVVIRMGDDVATSKYLAVKARYANEIDVGFEEVAVTATTLMPTIERLNADDAVTGIIIQLPLTDRTLEAAALAAVSPLKDIDGLAPNTPFDPATPKAALWLLGAYGHDYAGRQVTVVGQGKLVGAPLARILADSGAQVRTADITTPDLAALTLPAEIVIIATGRPGLVTAAMLASNAIVLDCGAPSAELSDDALARTDLTISPVPGGIGPMTVACLYDNLLIAAQTQAAA